MNIELSNDFGTNLCKHLGLDPNLITRVVIDILPGEPVRVYFEGMLERGKLHVELFEVDKVKVLEVVK